MFRVAVVRFPGSNCDFDTLRAVRRAGAEPYFVWHREPDLRHPDAVILPGGFSYGDYLRSGAIARFSPVMASVQRFAREGGPVLGICNGFQILCEAGLLPGALMRNSRLTFVSRPVQLRVEQPDTAFTNAYRRGQILTMPLAHGEGRYVADPETLRRLETEERVVVRYVGPDGGPLEEEINGSLHDIAGIANEAGNVVGLMPHPDRAADPDLGHTDGMGFFTSMLTGSPAAHPAS
ncbi:MAG TPA: phosphoribosylformylglycinamidine synthase subunit PurQ [Gemmatimonadales bacterium]|jgi:phosphoribosylformylglycinamidine synthase|nr:phosphoribosylformylglycinamidine synthase subunit PurQ [Gemmatimonadales bacterium]